LALLDHKVCSCNQLSRSSLGSHRWPL
jgi:hypothetical protein